MFRIGQCIIEEGSKSDGSGYIICIPKKIFGYVPGNARDCIEHTIYPRCFYGQRPTLREVGSDLRVEMDQYCDAVALAKAVEQWGEQNK
jgi:hypothetical protein